MNWLKMAVLAVALACISSCGGGGGDDDEGEARGDTSIQITIQGTGEGRVYHLLNPTPTDCSSGVCTWDFTPNLEVDLIAEPSQGSTFAGWGGDCAFANSTLAPNVCHLRVDHQFNITATFNLAPIQ